MGYLVISRKISERIQVGENIVIMISDIIERDDGSFTVDVAIDAPKEFNIKRRATHLEEINKNGPQPRNKSR